MKGSANQANHQSKEPAIHNNKPRPENKDNLDDRGDLEQNDVQAGNNEKELHIGKKNKHNDPQGEQPNKPDKAG